jgi:tripartite-type tricarboxylate transporter receptor subunit TctC
LAGRATTQAPWPARPFHAVISSLPGGAIDTVMRLVRPLMGEALGQPLAQRNRPGAAGSIAAAAIAAAAPDRHALLCDGSSHATAPHLIPGLSFHDHSAFMAATRLSSMPLLVVAHPPLPAGSAPGRLTRAAAVTLD